MAIETQKYQMKYLIPAVIFGIFFISLLLGGDYSNINFSNPQSSGYSVVILLWPILSIFFFYKYFKK